VGDSRLVVVRGLSSGHGRIVFATYTQQLSFNCPRQLTLYPGSHRTVDPTPHAQLATVALQVGDVIIMASDGLLDNLSEGAVLKILGETVSVGGGGAEAIAKALTRAAHRVAHDPSADTPYWEEARKAGHKGTGGKIDDISVIVTVVG
jgi:serine/threonine protein phosphatase PrpC